MLIKMLNSHISYSILETKKQPIIQSVTLYII